MLLNIKLRIYNQEYRAIFLLPIKDICSRSCRYEQKYKLSVSFDLHNGKIKRNIDNNNILFSELAERKRSVIC